MDHFSRSKYRFGNNIYPYISFSAIIYCQAKQRSRKSKNIVDSFVHDRIDFCCCKFFRRTLLHCEITKGCQRIVYISICECINDVHIDYVLDNGRSFFSNLLEY